MASTNKTTNYELSQFIETDRPAWLTDYNGDMRTIDSTMKAISDVASGASGSISELADRMSTAEGNISTNTNDIATLDARADSLEAQAQSTAGTIANIQTEQTAQNLGIEAATELGYNLARPYDSASTYAVGAYVLFQNTLYKCITAVPVGEAFDATKWLAIKATDEISAGGYTLPIASASQLGGVKVGNGLSIDPVTGLLSASGGNIEIESIEYSDLANIRPTSLVTVQNYYSGTYSSTANTLSNVTTALSNNIKSFFAKIGDIKILQIAINSTFDAVTISPKTYTSAGIRFNIPKLADELPVNSIGGYGYSFNTEPSTGSYVPNTGFAIQKHVFYADNSGGQVSISISALDFVFLFIW